MQALHAWSEGDVDPTKEWEAQYPPLAWCILPWAKTTKEHKVLVRERVEWMFRNLPLTDEERDSVCYTIKQSDITWPDDEVEALKTIPPAFEFPQKKPARNPARRKRDIIIEAPVPGTTPENVADNGNSGAPRLLRLYGDSGGIRRPPGRTRPSFRREGPPTVSFSFSTTGRSFWGAQSSSETLPTHNPTIEFEEEGER